MSSYYFAVIGTRDNPVYELEFSSFKSSTSQVVGEPHFSNKVKELLPFISNSSLDLVEDAQWLTNGLHLGRVDSFFGVLVNAFITQGNIKFILCSEGAPTSGSSLELITSSSKHDDVSIKHFFSETYDLYVKTLLSPFYSVNDPIVSPDFDHRVKALAKKYL